MCWIRCCSGVTVLCCGAGDQTGGEEKAAERSNGGDVNGEPRLRASSTAPQSGRARDGARRVLENVRVCSASRALAATQTSHEADAKGFFGEERCFLKCTRGVIVFIEASELGRAAQAEEPDAYGRLRRPDLHSNKEPQSIDEKSIMQKLKKLEKNLKLELNRLTKS